MLRTLVVSVILICLCSISAQSQVRNHEPAVKPVMYTGLEDSPITSTVLPSRIPNRTLDDYTPNSFVDTMIFTYYDYQQNGTFGKQVAVDLEGYTHFVWTNALNSGLSSRHIFYNVWDPYTDSFTVPGGVQVDASQKAGFVNVAVNNSGFAFPTFHQVASPEVNPHSASAIDFLPRTGAFTTFQIPILGTSQIIWPKVSVDYEGNLQTVHTESGGSSLDYYAKGIPEFDVDSFGLDILWPVGFVEWEPATFITMDVATSWHSNRVAVAWLNDPINDGTTVYGHDVLLRCSEDGGTTWGEVINITNYPAIDTNCVHDGGDPTICCGDTLRPWIDLSIAFDQNDVVHVAFSATGWYYWWPGDSTIGPYSLTARPSQIWHWDEANREFNLMAEKWEGRVPSGFGVNQLMCHRPNLAVDTVTNYLYCSYQQYDTAQTSENEHPQADAFVTMSTDGGRRWAVGTNVTNTYGGVLTPAPNCRSEIDINIAKFISDGKIHMQYCMDDDAGAAVISSPIGVVTYNEMIYQQIPVTDIQQRPIMDSTRALRADSTGMPNWLAVTDRPTISPSAFTLYANYPNPFNPSTKIQFDLRATGQAWLKVYDITGREVRSLMNGEPLTAGTHVVEFDGTGLASGVYFYRLEQSGAMATQKMILMK